ncbi:DUF6248 family natural product biosynthesis protein [Streptomyces mirabilis]|uniref:DUF6248 family natural product biosynthesis protein n=1 Tax=Streptomyces mirabilis TaxID=68239 RepID=UPI0036D8A0ED
MTTRLRHIGASLIGILKPAPSHTASPMSEEVGAWVRAHAWTKALRRIDRHIGQARTLLSQRPVRSTVVKRAAFRAQL